MSRNASRPWVAKELGGSFEEPRWVILWPDTSGPGLRMRRLDDNGNFDKADALLLAAAPELLADLRLAAATLRRYEALHRAKRTEDSLAKAEVNRELAEQFEATIAKAKGDA